MVELNDKQKLIVDNLENSILLTAKAGTGKTNTLACRIKNIVDSNKADSSEILCLTFTNKASNEMKDRIEKIGSSLYNSDVYTLHCFAVYILRQYSKKLTNLSSDFTILDEEDIKEVFGNIIIEEFGREGNDITINALNRYVGLVKQTQFEMSLSNMYQAIEYVNTYYDTKIRELSKNSNYKFDEKIYNFLIKRGTKILTSYNKHLGDSNKLDFNDLLIELRNLTYNEEILSEIVNRYKYIHVDEVQDTSIGEYRLIKTLFSKAIFLLCGDFNQTIYTFRGSNPKELIDLYVKDKNPLRIEFEKNYRSTKGILDASENFIYNNFVVDRTDFVPKHVVSEDVIVKEFKNQNEEIRYIYETIKKLNIDDYSDVAIITRTNNVCEKYCDLLSSIAAKESSDFSFMVSDEAKLFKKEEVKDVLSLIKIIASPYDTESICRFVSKYVKGIGDTTIKELIKLGSENERIKIYDLLDSKIEDGDYYKKLIDARESNNIVVFDVESTGTSIYEDDIIQIAAIRLDKDFKIIDKFEKFIYPSKDVGKSSDVHGFTMEYLKENGEDPLEVFKAFKEFIGDSVLIGHNITYDINILKNNIIRNNFDIEFLNVTYDTLEIARRYVEGVKNYKLITLVEALKIEFIPTHNAYDDIVATGGVLENLFKKYIVVDAKKRIELYDKYILKFKLVRDELEKIRLNLYNKNTKELIDNLIESYGFKTRYEGKENKLLNIERFKDFLGDIVDDNFINKRNIEKILEFTSLSSSRMDYLSKKDRKIPIITVHQSKGCEFSYVFMPSMNEGVFPSYLSKFGDDQAKNEEKRVFYVSLTRAKKKIFLTSFEESIEGKKSYKSSYLKQI